MESVLSEQINSKYIKRVVQPFQQFIQSEVFSGVLLLLSSVIALLWANSPWTTTYFNLREIIFSVSLGSWTLAEPLIFWVNEGLMFFFFLLVGLEIKREVLVGELASFRRALLPVVAALGGMLIPAILYRSLNEGNAGIGWGIPTATDIAFSLGALALLGKRVPSGLKVFITAFAIADDLGAVLVIALFYGHTISVSALSMVGAILLVLIVLNYLGMRHPTLYLILGGALWIAMLGSGIHTSIAGVLLAVVIPVRMRVQPDMFLTKVYNLLDEFPSNLAGDVALLKRHGVIVQAMENLGGQTEAPLLRIERRLQPWVLFAIMPVFALMNAGINLNGNIESVFSGNVALGVVVGLVLGKPVGIFLATWVATKTKMAVLPANVGWWHILGAGCFGGLGFTMSIFIADVAFVDPRLLTSAKVGILLAGVLALILGLLVFLLYPKEHSKKEHSKSATLSLDKDSRVTSNTPSSLGREGVTAGYQP